MFKYDIVNFDKIVSDLLSQYDKPYNYESTEPAVDIYRMAEAHGLKVNPPEFVPKEKKVSFLETDGTITEGSIKGNHAVIMRDGTVVMDERDRGNEGQIRFNIAHELAHVLLKHIKLPADCEVNVGLAARNFPNLIAKTFPFSNYRKKEEEADHLAANLLVPIYRFQFWEDKTDEEIAKAFKVDPKCIRKRQREIRDELNELKAAIIQNIDAPNARLGAVS
jgi:Zn-dependent peptidase ImmA (M78 family)